MIVKVINTGRATGDKNSSPEAEATKQKQKHQVNYLTVILSNQHALTLILACH